VNFEKFNADALNEQEELHFSVTVA